MENRIQIHIKAMRSRNTARLRNLLVKINEKSVVTISSLKLSSAMIWLYHAPVSFSGYRI
jgi:hypothetical protein